MKQETEKLFYIDQYLKEFEANIISITEHGQKYHVILDKTAFFPGGGGQSCDLGHIGNNVVIDVIEEKGSIIHILESNSELLSDYKVSGKIDWNRRFDGMQQHLAQHVLSGCFYSLFGINTCGIHLGEKISTVDLIGEVSDEQIRSAEKKANQVILENYKVNFMNVNRREAKSLGLRRELATKDDSIRIVKIEDLDINACCGIHTNNTLELQIIKIKKAERHKGNTRIEFLAGNRAVNDYLYRDVILEQVCNSLSAGDDEVMKSISNLNDNLKVFREDNVKLRAILSEYEVNQLVNEASKVNDVFIINKIFEDNNMKYLTKVANRLTDNGSTIVLFANIEKDKASLLFACSKNLKKVNVGDILKDSITLIDGRGGGSNTIAQGAGKNIANLENTMDYTIRKIQGLI